MKKYIAGLILIVCGLVIGLVIGMFNTNSKLALQNDKLSAQFNLEIEQVKRAKLISNPSYLEGIKDAGHCFPLTEAQSKADQRCMDAYNRIMGM